LPIPTCAATSGTHTVYVEVKDESGLSATDSTTVNWTVTHTNLFKAASSGAGGADWLSFYAQTDMHYIREIWFAGSPYNHPFFWLKKSPVLYVKNAHTPTLIFCGENDRRVPFPQSLELYRGLKRNGCTVEMVAFPGSGHGPRDLRQQLFKMKKEFSWFEKYIRHHKTPASDMP
jgi:dipeptidyl aminopeptidase/acylaminoacyl peptidase